MTPRSSSSPRKGKCRHDPCDAIRELWNYDCHPPRITLRCGACNATLSLGPANDSGEHAAAVAVEILLADGLAMNALAYNGRALEIADEWSIDVADMALTIHTAWQRHSDPSGEP